MGIADTDYQQHCCNSSAQSSSPALVMKKSFSLTLCYRCEAAQYQCLVYLTHPHNMPLAASVEDIKHPFPSNSKDWMTEMPRLHPRRANIQFQKQSSHQDTVNGNVEAGITRTVNSRFSKMIFFSLLLLICRCVLGSKCFFQDLFTIFHKKLSRSDAHLKNTHKRFMTRNSNAT